MKRTFIMATLSLILAACAPVLSRDIMKQGIRNVPLGALRSAPDQHRGQLYILGGVILSTRLTATSSQIEALYVPVDSYGNLEEEGRSEGRFLAVYPRSRGLLDPEVFRKGRTVTLAGEFTGVQEGKIDEMGYFYPVFEIKQLYLWPEARYDYYPPYYYYPYYYGYDQPFIYDRWGRPHPNPYWPPPPPW